MITAHKPGGSCSNLMQKKCRVVYFHASYQQEKQDYEKRVQERIGSDRFASRHAQTVNWALKTKEVGSIDCM